MSAPGTSHGLAGALVTKREQHKADFLQKVEKMSAGIKSKTLEDTFAEIPSDSKSAKAPAGLTTKYGLITSEELEAESRATPGTSIMEQPEELKIDHQVSRSVLKKVKALKRRREKLSFAQVAGGESESDDESLLMKRRKRRRAVKLTTLSLPVDISARNPTEPSARAALGESGASSSSAVAEIGPTRDSSNEVSYLRQLDDDRRADDRRKELEAEWQERETRLKRSKITVTYSYWDGSGHRRQIVVPRGATVGRYLEWVRQDLSADFPELAKISADGLIYVKEDMILPHGCDFHSLIEGKARGKSGPLFVFEVVEDVRMSTDHREEAAPVESHPGKVVERRWYEANKHVFPASRWELYDQAAAQQLQTAGRYTTHGKEVRGKYAKKVEEDASGAATGGGGGM